MPDDIERLTLHTADGVALEAEMQVPQGSTASVVLLHPHPLFGGSMRSLVTSELFRTLPEKGVTTLRFNFRGVEGSGGAHGGGRDERSDVIAAIDELAARCVARPIVSAAWSFGADVSLSVVDERLAGWFVIAAPLRILELDELVAGADPRPKCFATPEHDEFRTPDAVARITAEWTNTERHTVAGADHYLVGRTATVCDLLVDFIARLTAA